MELHAPTHRLLWKINKRFECKISIITEEGRFGQPKFSTLKKKTFCVVSALALAHFFSSLIIYTDIIRFIRVFFTD